MKIISKATAEAIWSAHREIEVSEKLKKDMAASLKDYVRDDSDAVLSDHYGRRRALELGVPNGSNGHRLFRLPPSVAGYCIDAHIANQQKLLAEACIMAQMELDGVAPAAEAPKLQAAE